VSGGEVGAKAASLTIVCGGDAAGFERVRPLLDTMGRNITLVGGNGDGQTTKVANQIILALNIAAVGEALLFASKAGAREHGLALPQTAGAAQLMQVCATNGMADLDHSTLVRALELMAHHQVASD
jgi:2-hydroxy-3-oxopropionate reductase